MAAVLAMPSAHAATYYWDTNGNTAGLGDTAGTWGTSAFWGSLNGASNRIVINGTQATANTAILAGDTVYFGTIDLPLGSTASTIGITGAGVQANQIVFGLGQGSQGVTLSGGGGTITLSNANASIFANNTGTNTVGAVLAGTDGLRHGGSGTTVLTGANAFTGGVRVNDGGTLQIGNGTSGSLASQALNFNTGGGVFNVRAANSGSTQAMGALTFANSSGVTVGEGTVQSTYGTSGSASLTFTSLAARQAGATGNFLVSGGTNGTTNTIVLTGAATGFLDRGLYFGGSSYAAYDAGGFVRGLIYGTDANTVAANTIAADNHVELTSSANNVGLALRSLQLAGSGVNFTIDSGSLTVPGILKTGGGSLSTISGGTSLTTASNAELVVRTDTSSDLLTISTAVTGFSGGLTKTGAGTLTLSGSNGYTGSTRINAGTLAVSGGSAIADNQAVILANAAGATLQLNGNETILNVTGGGFSGGNVNVQGNTLTLSGNAAYAFGGTFSGTGSGGIVKQGAGTLTLSNKNSFAGTIALEGGTLSFTYGNDGTGTLIALSSGGAFNMANGTTLNINPSANLPVGVIGSQLQAANGGTPPFPYGFTIANDVNIASGTSIANVTIAGNENSVRFTGNVTGGTSGSQTLAITTGNSQDRQVVAFSGVIADGSGGTLGLAATLRAANNGAYVNLTNNNTFTGPISVTTTGNAPGYLVIGGERYGVAPDLVTGSGSLGSGGVYSNTIALNNTGAGLSILNYASSANQTLGGTISGNGLILKDGTGILTLAGDNTYLGTTTVSAGTLLVNGDQSLATGAVTVSNSGSTLGGSGIVGGNATLNTLTILSPGNSPGTLTFDQNLTLIGGASAAGATAIFEGGDLVDVNGLLTLNTDWNLTLTSGFQDGGTVTLFTYGTAGTIDLTPDLDISGLGFTPSGPLSLTDTGSSIVLNGISIVPEPGTWALLGAGAALIGLRFARRRSSRSDRSPPLSMPAP
jgi:autotransporter-associated beta strand protein